MKNWLLNTLGLDSYYLWIKNTLQLCDVPPKYVDYSLDEHEVLMYKNMVYILENDGLRKAIL